jgi:uncharacterized protein YggE
VNVNTKSLCALILLASFPALTAFGQDIQVSRTNKTIEVTVTQTVTAEPEVAVVEVGYNNFGPTRDSTVDENVRASNKIIQGLMDGGIPESAIETEELQIQQYGPEANVPAAETRQRKFGANQEWDIHVPVAKAQQTVNLAIAAGANEVEDIDWTVKDPDALEEKAIAQAVAKARETATEILSGLGEKLGGLLYASNMSRRPKGWPFSGMQTQMASVSARRPVPKLRLFPKKVEKQATVHVIFAVE